MFRPGFNTLLVRSLKWIPQLRNQCCYRLLLRQLKADLSLLNLRVCALGFSYMMQILQDDQITFLRYSNQTVGYRQYSGKFIIA